MALFESAGEYAVLLLRTQRISSPTVAIGTKPCTPSRMSAAWTS